ncbi:uncharacterized protein LOC141606323 [Silene latifolia]|uniref:uncharacterized protein LOC141606323 n=1 Tax=Silene latifolia TaxID=37657 RepID=UPI003D789942
MKRGSAYVDTNPNPNPKPYGVSERQPISGQGIQQNNYGGGAGDASERQRMSEQGMQQNNYGGGGDTFAKSDEQWQWDRDAQQMSPHLYSDGQGGYVNKSFYSDPIPGPNQESGRVSSQVEQDMEIGYEENAGVPRTLDDVERRFRDDIIKLTKEQDETEDAEHARHKEKIIEINNQYQEKVAALRTRHATRREELFRKESQARLQQYQLAGVGTPPNNSAPADMSRGHRGYGPPGSVPVEPQRQYGSGQYDPYRRPESLERGRMQGSDTRVPTPNARSYNTGSRYY